MRPVALPRHGPSSANTSIRSYVLSLDHNNKPTAATLIWASFMQRHEFIAAQVTRDMFGLEIGPGYAPAFPKSEGWNVETADHITAEGLREKYRGMTEVNLIEHIDYVSDGRPIDEIVPRKHEYDFIYASHVIEHITDPIRFFRSCENLLKPTGKLLLAVPDKRRCFDALQYLTTTGNLLAPYHSTDFRHSRGNTFDFFANTSGLDGHGIWESNWTGDISLVHSIQHANELLKQAESRDEYSDIHAWRFTPSSFRLILKDLHDVGLIQLRESDFIPTERFEFFFSASISSDGCTESRIDLHRAIAREQIDGYRQIFQFTD